MTAITYLNSVNWFRHLSSLVVCNPGKCFIKWAFNRKRLPTQINLDDKQKFTTKFTTEIAGKDEDTGNYVFLFRLSIQQ